METKQPFDRVVDAHGVTVLRVARALMGPDDADDVWSETFLSALRAWPDLPADANHEAWLVTIARRRAVDALRARSRRPVPDEGAVAGLAGTAPAPAGAVGGGREDDLYAALGRLPDRQREAVAYHHLGGFPHEEVAAILGCSPAAARKASSDGVRALRRRLVTTEANHG